MRNTADPVLAYAPSPGMPELVSAVQAYYRGLGVSYEPGHILITAGGSEALTFLMLCILDEPIYLCIIFLLISIRYSELFWKRLGKSFLPV